LLILTVFLWNRRDVNARTGSEAALDLSNGDTLGTINPAALEQRSGITNKEQRKNRIRMPLMTIVLSKRTSQMDNSFL
jgi:hypothetical protein